MTTDRPKIDPVVYDLLLATQLRGFRRLLRTLAHDFNGTLNSMVINIELLRALSATRGGHEQAGDAAMEGEGRYVDALAHHVGRLKETLEVFLEQAGSRIDPSRAFDLRALMKDIATVITPQAIIERVSLTGTVPERSAFVHGSRSQIRQAIVNIALNALDAMPTGGELALDLKVSDSLATISVRDTGPGISPDIVDRVGTMHFTTKDTGTGVGLFVARAVAEAHDGSLSIHSVPDRGTCVELTLPVSDEEN